MASKKNLLEPQNPTSVEQSKTEVRPTTLLRRRKRRKNRFVPDFHIPGVIKLVLSELTQQFLGCIVGDTVTAEKPWASVDKDLIQEHLEANPEDSEFLPVKNEVAKFPGDEILLGYIPDEEADYDRFYVCVTEKAIATVNEIVEKMRHLQEEKLKNSLFRKIKQWKHLGSDKEIEEESIKCNRSLIEVEIESRYPIFPVNIIFRMAKPEDLRGGYMELLSSDIEPLSVIVKKRTDAFVQVAPSVVSNEAQTTCTYPKNSSTQYEYEILCLPWGNAAKSFVHFLSENINFLCDALRVNGVINLYSSDYESLIRSNKYGTPEEFISIKEYSCYVDMNLCGGKMVSDVGWHPMWTGCAILTYVDIAPNVYVSSRITTNEVYKAVHDTNPVLFWSFDDELKPKLILETPRPVYTISCCPHDPNLILGGCVNGQIILWDITNKLTNVEEEEALTLKQQKYREYMFSLMYWMKNIFDKSKVRPTAISDLKYSHKGCVRTISWMSPFHNVTKNGRIEEIEENSAYSLQLITGAEDGTIMIWDLLKKPTVTPGGFKAIRKPKRLRKIPSALMVMDSPFKILHLNLKPLYKINLTNRLVSIASLSTNFFKYIYEPLPRDSHKKLELSHRLIFKPVLRYENSNTRPTFYAGTMDGDFLQGMWEGQKFDSGEVVNFEDSQIIHSGKYHDGPIVGISYSPVNDTILTVGGKVFAFWRETFSNRPVLWRKSNVLYTHGSWFNFEQATIKLIRIDGYSEVWTVFYQSKSPLLVKLAANGAVNLITVHPRKLKKKVIGLCDYRGSMRLFTSQHVSPLITQAKEEQMSSFLTREIERKKAFLKWQSEWTKRHLSAAAVVEKRKEEALFETEEPKKKEEKKKVVKISPAKRYVESVREEHEKQTQTKIKKIILTKKNLDTEDLMKKREPLSKLEAETEIKRRRQKGRLKEADNIFKEQVAMLFPDVVKFKPPSLTNPHQDYSNDVSKRECFDKYLATATNAQNYVETNPFSHDFSWKTTIMEGRERRRKLDNRGIENHKKRYATSKGTKTILDADAEKMEPPSHESSFLTVSTGNTFY